MVVYLNNLRKIKKRLQKKSKRNFILQLAHHTHVDYLVNQLQFLFKDRLLESHLFFFFKLYSLYFYRFVTNNRCRKKSKKYLLFLSFDNKTVYFANIRAKFTRNYSTNHIIHNFPPRNFFITHKVGSMISFISAGMSTIQKKFSYLRHFRYLNGNLSVSIKNFFLRIQKFLNRFLILIYNALTKRVSFSLKTYFIVFKAFNKLLRIRWLKLHGIVIKRHKIFGFMRGERKPTRRKKIIKRRRRYLY